MSACLLSLSVMSLLLPVSGPTLALLDILLILLDGISCILQNDI